MTATSPTTEQEQQALFPRSIASTALIDRLRRAVEGKEVLLTYNQLSEVVGDDVRRHRHNLLTARKTIEREYGIRFQTVTGVGIKWASPTEVIQENRSLIRGVRRRIHQGSKRLFRCVDPTKLSRDEIPGFNAQLSVLAMVAHAVADKNVNAIEKQASETGGRLSLAETLAKTVEALK